MPISKKEKTTIESYNKTVEEYIKNVDTLHQYEASGRFISLISEGSLILDLGCGPGRDAKIFADKGFRVIGIDLSEKMIDAAKSRVKNADFRNMNLKQLDFKDDYFDAVWASASFLHIPKKDIPKAVKEVHRVLKSGGIFYLSLKEGEGESFEPDKRYDGAEKFWAYYTEEEIKKLLINEKFNVLEICVFKPENSYATHPWINVFCKKELI